jgi:hypothetical protein
MGEFFLLDPVISTMISYSGAHQNEVKDVLILADDDLLISRGEDGKIVKWSISKGPNFPFVIINNHMGAQVNGMISRVYLNSGNSILLSFGGGNNNIIESKNIRITEIKTGTT